MYPDLLDKKYDIVKHYRFIVRSKFFTILQTTHKINFANEKDREVIREQLHADKFIVHFDDKFQRFPSNEYYVNLDDATIRDSYANALKATMIDNRSIFEKEKENFYDAVKLLVAEITNENSTCVYDQEKFESVFALGWHDKC